MSKAEELADELDAWSERITRYTNSPGDSLCSDAAAHLRALEANRQMLVEALRVAVRQNSHDMLMTGEELRAAEAALEQAKELT